MSDIDKIYEDIDKSLSELRPNFGYVEKYEVAIEVYKLNNYLLPDTQLSNELVKLAIGEN
jgi:hypothetical protein